MDYIKAFLIGGTICMLVQILMDNTKLMPGRIMVMLVVTGSILGFLGLYRAFCKMGRLRCHSAAFGIWEYAVERGKRRVMKDGLLGLFTGGFTASAAGDRRSIDLRVSGGAGI